jgi:acyl-CoA thioesterase-2
LPAVSDNHITFGQMMTLEPHGPDTFVASGPQYPWGGLYGGQIVAQALRAASMTIEEGFLPHSLHAYFIRRGDATEPIRLEVDRIRNGRSFLTRRVVARQSGGAILNMSASFQVHEEGADVQTEAMPEVPAADSLPRDSWSPLFERGSLPEDLGPGRVGAWMRLTEEVGDDVSLNACALVYISDDLPTEAVLARHPQRPPHGQIGEHFWNASLDHAMWFHRPARAADWHLHDVTGHGLVNGRGLAIGNLFAADGTHIASLTQEVLTRPKRPL